MWKEYGQYMAQIPTRIAAALSPLLRSHSSLHGHWKADSEIFYQIAYYMGDWEGLDPNEEVIAWTELPENYRENKFNE